MLRSLTVRLACAVCVAVTVQILAVHAVWAAPVNGEQFRLPQPDGTWVDVRIWGDEFYGVTESLDGYTLVRDPATLFICYATLSADGKELVSTGVPAGTGPRAVPGLVPHLRIDPSAARSQASAVRARLEAGHEMMRDGGEPRRPRIGNIVGICLIVDFEDEPWTIPRATVDDYCNLAGFTGFGDNGSVRDYFFDVSDGALTYTNFVPTAYYRATHPKSYYTDPAIPFGQRARELIIEALTDLDAQGFDFSQYDADGDGNVDAVNCFYAGTIWNNWSEGLWPHSGWFSFCADGVCAQRYQISNMGSSLRLRTFCHETGHMLFNWPDLYDYDYDSKGLGKFCLMAYSTTDTNPSEPCAYLKYIAGWSQTTLLTVPQTGLVAPGPGINRIYKFNHPTLANEYYLIDNRQQAGRDSGLPDGGLAIWHIDTLGDNSDQQMTPELHYLVTLVQADGRWDLEHNLGYGDATDLWTAPQYTQCTPATTPNTNWWSGAASGLSITGISGSANMMAFDYGMPSDPRNIMAWGMNDSGQCDVPVPNGEFVAVAAGRGHTLGLRANGSIAAWGLNDHGQCNIPEPNTGFVAIAGGGWHSLGLKADGSIVAWGLNDHGQCDIPEPNTGFAAIAGGGYHSLGLKAHGSITAWGANTDESDNYIGQCDVPAPNAGFVAVSAGGFHSLGLKVDGSIVAWGAGQAGQSGHPHYGQCVVPDPDSDFIAVSAGAYHSLGLKADGSIVAWGWDNFGQCTVPTPNTGFIAVCGSQQWHSLGLKYDGSIVGWGRDTEGQCDVPAPNSGFVALAAGGYHSLGLRVYHRGDVNCDDLVDFQDISHFVQALIDPAGYAADHDGDPYPACDRVRGDMNGDGAVDGADIQSFVDSLLGS